MLRALIFDFDGLMVDTETTALLSWQELYAAHGKVLPLDKWATTIGTWNAAWDPACDLAERIGRPLTDAEAAERRAREAELALAQPLLPGVAAHLASAEARGLSLAIASSSSRSWVVRHLRRHGLLDLFECVCTRDDVARTKPDPELYLAALSCLRLPASDVLAYEDSVLGVAAARAAGLRVVAVPGPLTRDCDFTGADLVVRSLEGVEPGYLWERL